MGGAEPNASRRTPGSFKVNLDTGRWADFATGDKGGDLVALYAYFKDSRTAKRRGYSRQSWPSLAMKTAHGAHDQARRAGRQSHPFPTTPRHRRKIHYKHGKPTRVWTYRDAQGASCAMFGGLILNTAKTSCPSLSAGPATGKPPGAGKHCLPRPLYNLDKLAANRTADRYPYRRREAGGRSRRVVPGVRDYNHLNGAKSPHKTDLSSLASRIVWIWPDNDKAGRQYAERVAAAEVSPRK